MQLCLQKIVCSFGFAVSDFRYCNVTSTWDESNIVSYYCCFKHGCCSQFFSRMVKYITIEAFLKVFALLCSLSVCGLCISWLKNREYYVAKIDTIKHSLFAWHTVLSVCGCFLAQLLAIVSWGWPLSLITPTILSMKIQKSVHVVWQALATAMMIFALISIYKYTNQKKRVHLSTLHSWIGVGTFILWVALITLGATADVIKALILCRWYSTNASSMRMVQRLELSHQCLTVSAIVFTVVAIWTGISSVQGDSCSKAEEGTYPAGCKISNSLGLMVTITLLLVLAAVCRRGYWTSTVVAAAAPLASLSTPLLQPRGLSPSAPPIDEELPVATEVPYSNPHQ